MQNVFILENDLVSKYLGYLRDRNIGIAKFRKNAREIVKLLTGFSVSDIKDLDNFAVIAILRSAAAFLPAALEIIPSAKVGFAGLARDEKTAQAKEYYWKMPNFRGRNILIPDPMLATGGSALHVLRKIMPEKPKEVRIVSIVCAPEGIGAIHKEFPEIKIFTAALDKGLDAKKFIVPGLGDFGDRYFGTF